MFKGSKLYPALLVLLCLHFAFVYVNTLEPAFDYHAYAQGTVAGPYQTRLLLSLVFRALLHAVPAQTPLPGHLADPLLLAMLPIAAASLFFATDAVRRATLHLGLTPRLAALLSFSVPWMAYFHFDLAPEIRVQTPYDLPQLLCFAVAWLGIVRRSRWLFYTAFLLGSLNRETTLLLIPIWMLFEYDHHRGRTVLAEGAGLAALWTALRVLTVRFYPGSHQAVTFHLAQNLHFLRSPLHWMTMLSVFGFLGIPLAVYFRDVRLKPLRQTIGLALPWFALMCVVGDLLEVRIQSEWIPYVAICLALIAQAQTLTMEA